MEGANRGSALDPAAAEFRPAARPLSQPQVYYSLAAAPSSSAATRSVVLSMVPRYVGEADVRAAMEPFGGVQAVDVGSLAAEGVVTVHFYDLRSAHAVVAAVREHYATWQYPQPGRGFVYLLPGTAPWGSQCVFFDGSCHLPAGMPSVWAQFATAGIDEPNQGSVLVCNLDAVVSFAAIVQIFSAFGTVKQVMEAPTEPNSKLVEFFDKRDAARAIAELDGKEIHGRRLVLQFAAAAAAATAGTQKSSINWKMNNSAHQMKLLPPRFGVGSPKAAPFNLLSSSSSPKDAAPACPQSNGPGIDARERNSPKYSQSQQASWQQQQHHHHQYQQRRKNGWRMMNQYKGEGHDSRFLFKEGPQPERSSSTSSCRDSRTTVMIRNIPNKYSQKQLLNMLDAHCLECNKQIGDGGDDEHEPYSAYDFVYLPIDFNNMCNVGYGFVNMTSPEAAFRLYKALHQRPWEVFNSRKICQITYARLQGLEALKAHFRSSNLASDNDEYMPAVFLPPRDGRRLTVPAIIGCSPGQNEAVVTVEATDGCNCD